MSTLEGGRASPQMNIYCIPFSGGTTRKIPGHWASVGFPDCPSYCGISDCKTVILLEAVTSGLGHFMSKCHYISLELQNFRNLFN